MTYPASNSRPVQPARSLSNAQPYPSHLPQPPHLPQHPASAMGGMSPVHPTPSPSLGNAGRYHGDRSQLGVVASASSPHMPHPLSNRSVSHNPSPSLPPLRPVPMARSWTLEGPPHLESQSPTHLSLPLTRSPLHHPPLLRSTSASLVPGVSEAVSPIHSTGSLPSGGPERRNNPELGTRKPQRPGMKSKRSGPPKAKLGGPGGRTYEEMLAAGEVQDRRPSASPLPKDSIEQQHVVVDGKAKDPQESLMAVNAMPVPAGANSSANAAHSPVASAGEAERPAPAHSPADTGKGAPKTDEKVLWKGKEAVVHVPKATKDELSILSRAKLGTIAASFAPRRPTPSDWSDDTAIKDESNPWGELSGLSTAIIPPPLPSPSSPDNTSAGEIMSAKKGDSSTRGRERLDDQGSENPWEAPTVAPGSNFGRPSSSPDIPAVNEKKAGKRKKNRGKEHTESQVLPSPLADTAAQEDDSPWEVPAEVLQSSASATQLKIKGIAGLPPKPSFLGREAQPSTPKQSDAPAVADVPASNSAVAGSIAPSSPTTSLRSSNDSPSRRTFSAAGLGGNAFLRKSLGGMLKDPGTGKQRSGLARGSDAISSPLNRTSEDQKAKSDPEKGIAEPAGVPRVVDAKSPEFETVSLNEDPQNEDPQPTVDTGVSSPPAVTDTTEGDSPTKTITPARSRIWAPLLQTHQTQQGPGASQDDPKPLSVPSIAEENGSPTNDSSVTIGAAKRLRPLAPAFVPPDANVSRSPSTCPSAPSAVPHPGTRLSTVLDQASTIVPPQKLRPSASSFVPASSAAQDGPDPGPPASTLSGQIDADDNQADDRRGSLDTDDQSQKRARLRPTANAFVPRPTGTLRRVPAPTRTVQPGADSGQRIAPDTFCFAPQLSGAVSSLRPNPNAPAFVPSASAVSFAPRPPRPAATFARHPNGLPHGQFTFVSPGAPHLNPAFGRQNMAAPRIGPPAPLGWPAPHVNPALVPGGITLAHRLPGYALSRPINGQAAEPLSSHGSIDVADLFYQRPLSSIGSDQLHGPGDELSGSHPDVRQSLPGYQAQIDSQILDDAGLTQENGAAARGLVEPRSPLPNVPQSAHTEALSSSDSSPLRSGRPLPAARSEGGTGAHGLVTADPNVSALASGPAALASTPVRIREGPASTDGTFTTADGSPLLPRRFTPAPSPYRAVIPLALTPLAHGLPYGGSEVTPRPVPESPLLDSNISDRVADRSMSFPRPEIKVDPAADDRRFREWTFPAGRDGSLDRPSISRRHTMPVRDMEQDSPLLGVASTLAGRVQEFRDLLSQGSAGEGEEEPSGIAEEDEEELEEEGAMDRRTRMRRSVSAQSSVEFPMREERKALKVVNATPTSTLSPRLANREDRRATLGVIAGAPIVESPGPIDGAERLGEVLLVLHRLEASLDARNQQQIGDEVLKGLRDEFIETRKAVLESREETQSAFNSLFHRVTAEQLADALEQQASMLSSLRDTVELGRGDQVHGRTKEMFEAMLVGQHAILDRIAEAFEGSASTAESVNRIKAVQDEIACSLNDAAASRGDIAQLRAELDIANGRLIKAQTEKEGLELKVRSLQHEAGQAREGLGGAQTQLDAALEREKAVKDELDISQAARLAAERERDALSEALRAGMANTERLNEELRDARKDLATEREKAIASREGAESLANVASTAVAFHEEVLSRLTRLDEGMFESMESRVKEFERVVDRKNNLEQELGPLREKYESVLHDNTAVRLAQQEAKAEHDSAIASLHHELELAKQARKAEVARREESDGRAAEMQRQMDILRHERESARLMANERASWARLSEVRLQSLSQEAVYWRQFALETDRHRYRTYMGSNPFQNGSTAGAHGAQGHAATSTNMSVSTSRDSLASHRSPPDTQLKTPGDALRNGSGPAAMQTPTKGNGAVQSLADSVSNGSIERRVGDAAGKGQVYEQVIDGLKATRVEGEGGTLWTVA